MGVLLVHGIPDRVAARRMTVFSNPIFTDARYRLGLDGVVASLLRLSSAACGQNWQPLSSVLGDIAACMGINSAAVPTGLPNTSTVSRLLSEFEDAVHAGDLVSVRDLLIEMLNGMGIHWKPSSQWNRLYSHRPVSAKRNQTEFQS